MGCDFCYYKNDVLIGSFCYYKFIQEIHSSSNSLHETDINEFKSGLKIDIFNIKEEIKLERTKYKKKVEECRDILDWYCIDLKPFSDIIKDLSFIENYIKELKKALNFYKFQLKFIIEKEIDRIYISF